MVEPSVIYETGRMSILVEPKLGGWSGPQWLVTVNRRCTERFAGASAVAWCETRENAQALAHLLAGVETARERAVIWPDGRIDITAVSAASKPALMEEEN